MMDNTYYCNITKKQRIINLSWIRRICNKYNVNIVSYLNEHFIKSNECESPRICANCQKDLYVLFKITNDKQYIIYYDGYLCERLDCKNSISISILGIEYDIESYQRIGSRPEYLSLKYNLSILDANKMKYSPPIEKFTCDLLSYIRLYGEIEGNKKYLERGNKISNSTKSEWFIEEYGADIGLEKYNKYKYDKKRDLQTYIEKFGHELGLEKYNKRSINIGYSNTKQYYVEKFGYELGSIKYDTYIENLRKVKHDKVSKSSQCLSTLLDNLGIEYIQEYSVHRKIAYCYFVDYYLPTLNIIIEFFGDYYHANPKVYENNYWFKTFKMTSKDLWEKDTNRLNEVSDQTNCSILIIWESSSKTLNIETLMNLLNTIKDKKTILYF